MGKGLKLREVAAKAGRWLGVGPRETQANAVIADRFDAMSWDETYAEARALQALANELQELLGHLVVYSIFDGSVTPDTLDLWFTELDLDSASRAKRSQRSWCGV